MIKKRMKFMIHNMRQAQAVAWLSVGAAFGAGLAGIRPDAEAPGLSRIRIRPEPVGDVKWVKASQETFRGPLRAAEIGSGHYDVEVKDFRK